MSKQPEVPDVKVEKILADVDLKTYTRIYAAIFDASKAWEPEWALQDDVRYPASLDVVLQGENDWVPENGLLIVRKQGFKHMLYGDDFGLQNVEPVLTDLAWLHGVEVYWSEETGFVPTANTLGLRLVFREVYIEFEDGQVRWLLFGQPSLPFGQGIYVFDKRDLRPGMTHPLALYVRSSPAWDCVGDGGNF